MLSTANEPSSSETRHSYQSTTGAAKQLGAFSSALAHQLPRLVKTDDENNVGNNDDSSGGSGGDGDHGRHTGHKSGGAGRSGSLSRFNQMAMLYAIFLTLFGLIFPLSGYVSAKPYSDWYLSGFYITLHSSAIAFLLFFLAWVMNRPSQKLFVENSAEHVGEVVRLPESESLAASAGQGKAADRDKFKIGRFAVSESSHDLEGKEERRGLKNQQKQQHVQLQELKHNSAAGQSQTAELQQQQQRTETSSEAVQSDSLMSRIDSTLIRNAKELGVHEIQAYSVLSLQESHSPSFFLRIACFLFGGLNVTHDFLHIVDTLTEARNQCVEGGEAAIELIQYAISIAFTVLQTFFIFKYSKVSINIYHRVSVFGFMHLMATNMCVWFQAILLETGHNAEKHAAKASHSYPSTAPFSQHESIDGNYSTVQVTKVLQISHGYSAPNCSKEVFWRMAPYLFPFTIEYSLMAAFFCYVLYCNVGKFLYVIQTKGFNLGKKCLRNRKKTQTSFSASCYKSDKGFFLGALQMIVGVTSGIYFTVYITEEPDDLIVGKYIYLGTDLTLLTLNLALCIVAYRQMQALTLVQQMSTGPDAWLLGITLIGVLVFELFQLFGAFAEQGLFFALRLLHGAICIMQSLLQVFLVLDGEKRRSGTSQAIERKPGREMIASLLLGNLALWVVYTLEIREINNLPNYNDAYILIAAQIFSYLCSPLIIFFRFHSACCFVDIWRHAYRVHNGNSSPRQTEETGGQLLQGQH